MRLKTPTSTGISKVVQIVTHNSKDALDQMAYRSATIVRFSVIESFEDTDGFQVNKEVQGGAGHYSERPAS